MKKMIYSLIAASLLATANAADVSTDFNIADVDLTANTSTLDTATTGGSWSGVSATGGVVNITSNQFVIGNPANSTTNLCLAQVDFDTAINIDGATIALDVTVNGAGGKEGIIYFDLFNGTTRLSRIGISVDDGANRGTLSHFTSAIEPGSLTWGGTTGDGNIYTDSTNLGTPDLTWEAALETETVTFTLGATNYAVAATDDAGAVTGDGVINATGLAYLTGVDMGANTTFDSIRIIAVGNKASVNLDNLSVSAAEVATLSVAVADSYSTDNETALVVDTATGVLANDTIVGTDKINTTPVVAPTKGSVTISSTGSFTYTPSDITMAYEDTFTYEIVKSDGSSYAPAITAVATITVSDANVANDDSYQMLVNNVLTVAAPGVLANDTSAAGVTAVSGGTTTESGTYNISTDGSFDYTPATDFVGTDTFDYTLGTETATVTITVNASPQTPDDSSADIHAVAGWSSDVLPTSDFPGVVNVDCLIKTSVDHVKASDIVYTINPGVTVTRGSTTGRIDFGGSSEITIDGTLDLFGTEDGVTSSRFEENVVVTVNSDGLFSLVDSTGANTITIVRDSSKLYVKGGTVDVTALSIEDPASLLQVEHGSSVKVGAEITVGGIINFTDGSTGTIDIAAHADVNAATTYWTGLWTADLLTYNGQTATELGAATRAQALFSDFFAIDATTFALKVDSSLTPAVGINVVQEGTTVTWTIESQVGVAKYIVTDADGTEYVVIAEEGTTEYSQIVNVEGEVTLTVVDTNDYAQTFVPADGNVIKVVYDLVEGWNLIAIAGANADTSELGTVWGWNGDSYEIEEAPEAGQAVWVYSPATVQTIVAAEKVQVELELTSGWNMVGPTVNMQVPAEAHTVYGWTDTYQTIANDGTLLQGVGYWIFSVGE